MNRPPACPRAAPWLALALVSCLAACTAKSEAPEPVRAVRTLTVGAQGQGGAAEFAAEVRARTESVLSFRVGGRMDSRPANVGDQVRTGQVLAHLDASDLQLGQAAAQAALRAAQTNADQLEAELRRYRDLREQGFIGPAELERRDAAAKAARAQAEQARAQGAVSGRQTDYANLLAPASGVVTAVTAEPGQVLAAGSPVLRLALDGPRDVVFAVPEDHVGAVRSLLGRAGALKVRLWGDSTEWPATVREVAAAADSATRTFQIKADLGAAPARLGQTANVSMPAAPTAQGLRLPLTALVAHQGGSGVWRFDRAAGRVHLVPVVVATAEGNEVLISQGVKAGEEVVVAGTHVLTDGQQVRPWVPVSQTAAASAAAH